MYLVCMLAQMSMDIIDACTLHHVPAQVCALQLIALWYAMRLIWAGHSPDCHHVYFVILRWRHCICVLWILLYKLQNLHAYINSVRMISTYMFMYAWVRNVFSIVMPVITLNFERGIHRCKHNLLSHPVMKHIFLYCKEYLNEVITSAVCTMIQVAWISFQFVVETGANVHL